MFSASNLGSSNVGSVSVNLTLNTGAFNKGVNNSVSNATNQYSRAFSSIEKSGTSTFGKLGKLAIAVFSIKAITDFGKKSTDLGSDLQEVQNVVDVTFGTLSDKVNEFASNTIDTIGLSETVAKKYMGTFGAMNNQFGFTVKQSYEMSKAITKLTGDVASFYNLSSDEAYTKLKSIWTDETESLKEIGVVMTQSALDQYALANGFGKTTAKMTEQEKVALRYAFVQDKLSLASGDFARTQDGWANQTRILSLRWQQFMATMGRGLINVLTPLVKIINLLISKLQVFANAFKKVTSLIFGDSNSDDSKTQLSNINDGLSSIGSTANGSADSVSSATKKIKRSLSKVDELNILNNNKNSNSSLGSGISDQVLNASGLNDISNTNISSGMDNTGDSISKLTLKIKELIKPLQAIDFSNLKEGLDKIKIALQPINKKLVSGLEWLWSKILVPLATWTIEDFLPSYLNAVASGLTFLNSAINFAKPYLQFLWEDFLKPISSWTGGKIVDYLEWVGNKLSVIGELLNKHEPNIKNLKRELKPFGDMFKEVGKFLGNIISLSWNDFSKKVEFLWNNALQPIWNYFLKPLLVDEWNKLKNLSTVISEIFNALNSLMSGDWPSVGQSIVSGLTDGLKDIWEGSFVKKYFYDPIVGGFKKLFGIHSPSTVFEELGRNLLAGLSNGLGNLYDWAIGKFQNIISGFSGAFDKGKEIGSKLLGGLGTGIGNIKDWAINKKNNLVDGFSGLANNIKSKGSEIRTGLANGLGDMKTWASGKLTDIKNGFSGAQGVMSKVGTNLWNGLKDTFSVKTLGLKVDYDKNVGAIKKSIYKALGLEGWPKLSFLAQGGWVGPNNPQLAVVGDNKREGEIISPESKIYEQVKRGIKDSGVSGNKQELAITLYVKYEDGRTIIQKVNQAQIDEGKILLLT